MAVFDLGLPSVPLGLTVPTVILVQEQEHFDPDIVPVSAVVASSLAIRLDFSVPLEVGGSTTDVTKYVITQNAPANGVVPTVSAATVAADRKSVTLTVSEMTLGQSYRLTVTGAAGITDGYTDFVGFGVKPSVASATKVSAQVIRVTFSERMTINGNLTNVAKYTIVPTDGGSLTRVTSVVAGPSGVGYADYVDVTFAGGAPGRSYRVVVTIDA